MAGGIICDTINGDDISGGFLGVGQTWQNVFSSRSNNVTYTNNTGRPIVIVTQFQSDSASDYVNYYIDGDIVAKSGYGSNGSTINYFNITLIIPDGSTYKFVQNGGVMQEWNELR